MKHETPKTTSRRQFLKHTGAIAATSAIAATIVPKIYAAEDNTIKIALVGCGGRGGGAAANALATPQGPTKLVALADVFQSRLDRCYQSLKGMSEKQVDVPEDRRFIGFDAYKKAMDCLNPGDIVILTTPPAFRWVHFTYAIQKGLNVFMEKPVTVDGPTCRRMFELGKQAQAKNLKVAVGLMSRHSRALQELHQRIEDGEIGDLILMRGYRMGGPIGFFASRPKPDDISHLRYQIQRFHSFIWASGGCYSDFNIHHIDELCWMKNAWPVKAQALGGRHYKTSPEGVDYVDQNFDAYSVEYIFEDGARMIMDGRCIAGCKEIYSSYAHGSNGSAIVSKSGDCGLPSSTHKGQNTDEANQIWVSKLRPQDRNPYQNEWNDYMDAVRGDKPYTELERGVNASLVTSMGRMAAHTGQEITYDMMLNCEHEMAPNLDKLTEDSPAPLQPGPDGKYPVPRPGIVKNREY